MIRVEHPAEFEPASQPKETNRVSSAWHVTHEDGRKEIIHDSDLARLLRVLLDMRDNEEAGEIRWSS